MKSFPLCQIHHPDRNNAKYAGKERKNRRKSTFHGVLWVKTNGEKVRKHAEKKVFCAEIF